MTQHIQRSNNVLENVPVVKFFFYCVWNRAFGRLPLTLGVFIYVESMESCIRQIAINTGIMYSCNLESMELCILANYI